MEINGPVWSIPQSWTYFSSTQSPFKAATINPRDCNPSSVSSSHTNVSSYTNICMAERLTTKPACLEIIPIDEVSEKYHDLFCVWKVK